VPDLSRWEQLVRSDKAKYDKTVTIGLVAKYVDNSDTYLSVTEALKSAAWSQESDVEIKWLNAETATDEDFASVDGLVVPGGFGSRGVEGKIAAARYALDHNVPYLGLCLGLQVAVIAAARRAGVEDANSTEFDAETLHDVVYIMPGQEGMESTGGTMRLGDYPATLEEGSLVASLYNIDHIVERHRHRYEVNQLFIDDIKKGGLTISGTSPDGSLVEFVEAPQNDFFAATQAHPEFRSRPMRAHPLFVGLVKAASVSR
jgi:CTP synthase